MQTPEPLPPRPPPQPVPRPPAPTPRTAGGFWAAGEQLTWVAGLVVAVSAFTDWYAGDSARGLPTYAVTGWHTGVLGKLVFASGAAILALQGLRAMGIELPADIPDSLVVLGIGALATIFVLIRLIAIPEELVDVHRGVGIWISLVATICVVAGGLLRAAEEL